MGVSQYTVGEAARLSGVSVRTLHHYDSIGLVTPSGRSAAGYRLYSEVDLRRLRQVLFYRELEFRLEEIAEMLSDPQARTDDHLRKQHRLANERLERDQSLLRAIEKEMEARRMGISLTPEEQFELFGGNFDDDQTEAEQRWGDTQVWSQSERRSVAYTRQDWATIKKQSEENVHEFARALRAGEAASGTVATGLAEAHRQHISRWFYDCQYDTHRGLAEMYASDPRYADTYDRIAPGLAAYIHDAIVSNADRAEGSPGEVG